MPPKKKASSTAKTVQSLPISPPQLSSTETPLGQTVASGSHAAPSSAGASARPAAGEWDDSEMPSTTDRRVRADVIPMHVPLAVGSAFASPFSIVRHMQQQSHAGDDSVAHQSQSLNLLSDAPAGHQTKPATFPTVPPASAFAFASSTSYPPLLSASRSIANTIRRSVSTSKALEQHLLMPAGSMVVIGGGGGGAASGSGAREPAATNTRPTATTNALTTLHIPSKRREKNAEEEDDNDTWHLLQGLTRTAAVGSGESEDADDAYFNAINKAVRTSVALADSHSDSDDNANSCDSYCVTSDDECPTPRYLGPLTTEAGEELLEIDLESWSDSDGSAIADVRTQKHPTKRQQADKTRSATPSKQQSGTKINPPHSASRNAQASQAAKAKRKQRTAPITLPPQSTKKPTARPPQPQACAKHIARKAPAPAVKQSSAAAKVKKAIVSASTKKASAAPIPKPTKSAGRKRS